MRHVLDGLRIPRAMQRVLTLLQPRDDESAFDAAWQRAPWLYDLADELLRTAAGEARDAATVPRELVYASTPFELVPVSWNGGDGLHYDWAALAPELDEDDFPMVSFAPGDEDGAVWLGDDTAEGLANLLVGHRRSWEEAGDDLPDPALDARWATLVEAIGRAPALTDSRISAGARSGLELAPKVPSGWRYEPAADGVGVLAPNASFGALDVASVVGMDASSRAQDATRLMRAGAYAGALVQWKELRAELGHPPDVIERMGECYVGLGRAMHARRAKLWLSRR